MAAADECWYGLWPCLYLNYNQKGQAELVFTYSVCRVFVLGGYVMTFIKKPLAQAGVEEEADGSGVVKPPI